MAIVFFEEQKRQQLLVLIFAVVVVAIAAVFWLGVFRKGGDEAINLPSSPYSKKTEINFQTLDNPALSTRNLFQEIPPRIDLAGRDNPFLPESQPPVE